MGKFEMRTCEIPGLMVLEPAVHADSRGYFMETYNQRDLEALGLGTVFVQDNQAQSHRGVLRGLHYQKDHPQAKLVRVIRGTVFDVAVDIRPDSPTFGKWHGEVLSQENRRQFYIPGGFAHGYLVLSEEAEFCYKCSDFYAPEDQWGIRWNDPQIGICWPQIPEGEITLLERDRLWPLLRDASL